LSGYTAKVAGTEAGVTSAGDVLDLLRGAVPATAADTLRGTAARADGETPGVGVAGEHRLERRRVRRWPADATGGDAGAAQGGRWRTVGRRADDSGPVFGMMVPNSGPGVPSEMMRPRDTWSDKAAFDAQARKLAELFAKTSRSSSRGSDPRRRPARVMVRDASEKRRNASPKRRE